MKKVDEAYKDYKKKESLLTNYQLCRAYLTNGGGSVLSLAQTILLQKYTAPWAQKVIKKHFLAARGVQRPRIVIPQLNYNESVSDILSKYVKTNFGKMITHRKTNRFENSYPLMFKELAEKHGL